MHTLPAKPRLTKAGVTFSVTVEFTTYSCLASNEGLAKLCEHLDTKETAMQTFLAFEAKIHGVARRLIAAGVPRNPVVLGPNAFR
ncbi:MAG TPA: hypothetical protein VGM52_12340 [Herbaspirillum sp.]